MDAGAAGAGPVARPGRCSARDLGRARRQRLWADGTTLVLDGPGGRRTWPAPQQVRVHDAARPASGEARSWWDAGAGLELPAGDGVLRLRLSEWLPDPDGRSFAQPHVDPLEASGIGPVLRSAGVEVRPGRRRSRSRDVPRDRRFPTAVALSAGFAVFTMLVLALPDPFAAWAGLLLALDVLALAVLVRSAELPRSRSRRWRADDDVRPRPDGPRARRFLRRARLAAVGSELVLVDSARGELWLGTEPVTGAATLTTVVCDGRPLRADLRRADGTVLARLPWDDWGAGDGGAALTAFALRHGLAVVPEDVAAPPVVLHGRQRRPHYGVAPHLREAHWKACLDAGGFLPPAVFPGSYAALALVVTRGDGAVAVTGRVLATTALLVVVVPALVRTVRRQWLARPVTRRG